MTLTFNFLLDFTCQKLRFQMVIMWSWKHCDSYKFEDWSQTYIFTDVEAFSDHWMKQLVNEDCLSSATKDDEQKLASFFSFILPFGILGVYSLHLNLTCINMTIPFWFNFPNRCIFHSTISTIPVSIEASYAWALQMFCSLFAPLSPFFLSHYTYVCIQCIHTQTHAQPKQQYVTQCSF